MWPLRGLLVLFMDVVRMESLKLFHVIASTFLKWHMGSCTHG